MKVYEADLYRWEGDISVLKKLKWLLVPRYRIVYFTDFSIKFIYLYIQLK